MKIPLLRLILFALISGALAIVPAAGGTAVIGSVAGSMNATVGGQSLLPNTTIFSGDSLQVKDGVAVIGVGNKSRVIFGRDTVASFLRNSNEITVMLSQGNVSMLQPHDGTPMRVKARNLSVTSAPGFKTLGEVAMLNDAVVVTAKEGSLQVEDHGTTKNVTKGQTIVITPKTADNHGSGGVGWGSKGNTYLLVAAVAAGGTAAVLAGVAMSRAGDANTNAINAIDAANSATAAANAATSAANAAASAAAAAAASAAQADLLAECSYDLTQTGTTSSPIVIPPGTCPGTSATSSQ